MAPPWATNPAPKTESAREARKAFHCALCQKGYSRINELEAHQGSYDHMHKQRLKDLKHLTRASDPTAVARARKLEAKAQAEVGGGMAIKPIALAGAGAGAGGKQQQQKKGFKRGGFRNAFGGDVAEEGEGEKVDGGRCEEGGEEGVRVEKGEGGNEGEEEEEEEEEEGRWGDYDPRRPTGCGEWCRGHV